MSRCRLSLFAVALVSVGLALPLACTPDEAPPDQFRGDFSPPLGAVPAPLDQAYCEILVEGEGVKDMETDYLPRVITCENGGANLEALKAQAIAARSVAYYYVAKQGSVCDSQGCQVYTCNAEPSAKAYQAVAETSGIYLSYNDTLTYAFYVAGDPNTAAPSCVGNVNVGTEHWVTYNEGNLGNDVEQTELGWVFEPGENGFGQNRGCMSQWGARCLENSNGYDYEDIIRFYYGEDTELVQAQGPCVEDRGGDGDGDPNPTTSGDGDPTGDGDGDSGGSGPDPDTGVPCSVGELGCECTMGGGCDPGLICLDGQCLPEGPSEAGGDGDGDGDPSDESGTDADAGGETSSITAGFQDDAFANADGCGCAAEPTPGGKAGGLALLALFGLVGRRRRR